MITSGLEASLNTVGSDMGPHDNTLAAVTNCPIARSATGTDGGKRLNSMRRGRVEQDRLIEVQGKHMALSDANVGIRPHPRGDHFASD